MAAESYLSKPVLISNLPEVECLGKFVYNFYLENERTTESGDDYGLGQFVSTDTVLGDITSEVQSVNTDTITDVDLLKFYGRNAVVPRYVQLRITPPAVNTRRMRSDSEAYINASVNENASNVFGRLGLSVIDTTIQDTAYNILSSTIQESSPPTSDNEAIIASLTTNIQAQGYRYSEDQDRNEIVDVVSQKLLGKHFDFSLLSNTSVDLLSGSLGNIKTVYAEEISSAVDQIQQNGIQQSAITIDPYVLRVSDFDEDLPAVEQEDVSSTTSTLRNFLIGYVIEKFSLNPDRTLKIFPQSVIFNPNLTQVLDANVAYGSAYRYRVKGLYLCDFIATLVNDSGDVRRVLMKTTFTSQGADFVVNCVENIAPPPPVDLKFRYRGDDRGLIITWNFPLNLSRDIKKFQVFRRKSIRGPFELIQVYDFDNSEIKTVDPEQVPQYLIQRSILPVTRHYDTKFDNNSKYIYAIVAVDAHGLSSNFSVQMQVEYDRYRNKLNVSSISRSGAPKTYPNLYLNNDTFVDTMKMSGYTRLNIYFDPDYAVVQDTLGTGDPDVNHIVFSNDDTDNNTYKLLIVNTDFQKQRVLTIKVNDSYVAPPVITSTTARVFSPS